MKDIVIIGAGGFAREVAWLIEEINSNLLEWNLLGFIDDNVNSVGKELNGYKVLGTTEYLNELPESVYSVIGIGDGSIRKKIVSKLMNRKFATLIHPSVSISKTNIFGDGVIICAGNILTVNIKIGNHVIINLDCTVGHDVEIKDYVTVLPSVNISGNTKIGEYTTLGTGAKIIQGINIGKNIIVGAGTVVIRDVDNGCTLVGNPGKIIKNKSENL